MMRRSLFILLFCTAIAGTSYGQDGAVEGMETLYARPGHPTMVIYVMGDVGTSGRWRVEHEVKLLDLLAVAQPAVIMTEESPSVEDVRVQVYRGSDQGRTLTFDESIESLLTSSSAGLPLQEDDIVVVDLIDKSQSSRTIQTVLQIVTSVASLVLSAIAVASR